MYLNIKIKSLDIRFDHLFSSCAMAENEKNGCFRLLAFVCDTALCVILPKPDYKLWQGWQLRTEKRACLVGFVFNITK